MFIILVLVIIIIFEGIFMSGIFHSVMDMPESGIVPDETTAISIAEAVWLPIYGDKIYKEQPFVAEYDSKKGYWYVHGTLPENTIGGVVEIKISRSNGRIVYVNHGQ
jgi:hypothetical protein